MSGIAGFYRSSENVAGDVNVALSKLNHRGQFSAGIALSMSDGIWCDKEKGLVSEVAIPHRWSERPGRIGIGHVLYARNPDTSIASADPTITSSPIGPIAIAHEGRILNSEEMRRKLAKAGFDFETKSEGETIALVLVWKLQQEYSMVDAIRALQQELVGAYSVVVSTVDSLYGFCDPHRIWPLSWGKIEDGVGIASESCALVARQAQEIQDFGPGQIVIANKDGGRTEEGLNLGWKPCIFDDVYTARPDSNIRGRNIGMTRFQAGQTVLNEYLASKNPLIPERICPMPHTGLYGGLGAITAGITHGILPTMGVIKDRFDPRRTFIEPEQEDRERGVELTFDFIPEFLQGTIAAVDDSIVRGTTKRVIVQKLREHGAERVIILICSPPYRYPCLLGSGAECKADLPASYLDIDGVRGFIGADALHYISEKGLIKAIGLPENEFCRACQNGQYPVEIPPSLLEA